MDNKVRTHRDQVTTERGESESPHRLAPLSSCVSCITTILIIITSNRSTRARHEKQQKTAAAAASDGRLKERRRRQRQKWHRQIALTDKTEQIFLHRRLMKTKMLLSFSFQCCSDHSHSLCSVAELTVQRFKSPLV